MCRSTVATVRSVADGVAIVDLDGGERRRASTLLLPEVAPGDVVLVGLGTILGRVSPADLDALQALEAGMTATDPSLAPVALEPQGARP